MINQRFRVDTIYAKSFEDNPLHAPVERELAIYLPPSYFTEENARYTTVYFLHGYSGNNHSLTVYPSLEEDPRLASMLSVPAIAQQLDVEQIPFDNTFDGLIAEEKIEPMIFIQPDGSLHHPNKYGLTTPTGDSVTKGSFYVNSPYTGNYENYILEVIKYIDTKYRTNADRAHRLRARVDLEDVVNYLVLILDSR
jgi:enterochelin esterase family protein